VARFNHLISALITGCVLVCPAAQASNVACNFTITRPTAPRLNFKQLTLMVNACGATSATVTADGQAVVSSLAGGNVVFTTAGTSVIVNLAGTTTTTGLGNFTKAVLKDDKKWAWSHGLDDNYDQSMNSQINAFKAHNYTGTCFWNGVALGWQPVDMTTAVSAKWTIGNHTWSHEGSDGTALTDNLEVTQSDQAIITAIGAAGVPGYLVNTFANPFFDGKWNTIVTNLYNAGTTNIVLLETGQTPCKFICDSGAATTGGYSPVSYALPWVIGRDFNAYANVNATTDYMHTNSNATHHLWYNSGNDAPTDGSGSGATAAVAHVFSLYNAEAWVASSAEVYDYLLTRKNSSVTFTGSNNTSIKTAMVPFRRVSGGGALKTFDLRGNALAVNPRASSASRAAGIYLTGFASDNGREMLKVIAR
jgi:hypothetical protein